MAQGAADGIPDIHYSVILPADSKDKRAVRKTLRSLTRQLHAGWELIVVADAGCAGWDDDLARDDSVRRKVRLVVPDAAPNVAAALNVGLSQASAPWVAFLEPGDELPPGALLWMRCYQADFPEARWLYSDEVLRRGWGLSADWHCKPDFSPEHLLSRFFTGNLAVYAQSALADVGGVREAYGDAALYDLCLRLAERLSPSQIVHVPHVLYRRRPRDRSVTWPETLSANRLAALRDALARRNLAATIDRHEGASRLPRIRLQPARRPKTTVVIATRNHADLVRPCITSLREQTRYENYGITVIDNQSDEPELLGYLADLSRQGVVQVHQYDKPFNHSEMHNEAIAGSDSKYLVLLNNDVWGFSAGWLEELVATAESDDTIAAVGAKLLYPDNTIQHAGVILGIRGRPFHGQRELPQTSDGYCGRANALQEYSVVTAALVLLRRDAYLHVRGFDSQMFPTSYNDVDLCLRLRQAGYRCIYNPSVQAYHFESKTRGRSPLEEEYCRRLAERWPQHVNYDSFYNPNLSSRHAFRTELRRVSSEELAARLQAAKA
ncbi:MAG: glycosyltransferase [Pirellulaceae bacterium]|nr:glycosyltransferase [Pirellulaceae bacterium]